MNSILPPSSPGPKTHGSPTQLMTESAQANSCTFPRVSSRPTSLQYLARCVLLVLYYVAQVSFIGLGSLLASGTALEDSVAGRPSQQTQLAVHKMN